jgi:hypothetical protein
VVLYRDGVAGQLCGREDRAEPNARAVLGRDEAVVQPQRAEAGVLRSHGVAERGERVVEEDLEAAVPVARQEHRRLAAVREPHREPVAEVVEQPVRGVVHLLIVDGRGGVDDRKQHRDAEGHDGPRLRPERAGAVGLGDLARLRPPRDRREADDARAQVPGTLRHLRLELRARAPAGLAARVRLRDSCRTRRARPVPTLPRSLHRSPPPDGPPPRCAAIASRHPR